MGERGDIWAGRYDGTEYRITGCGDEDCMVEERLPDGRWTASDDQHAYALLVFLFLEQRKELAASKTAREYVDSIP
jgi:hypothetical protein